MCKISNYQTLILSWNNLLYMGKHSSYIIFSLLSKVVLFFLYLINPFDFSTFLYQYFAQTPSDFLLPFGQLNIFVENDIPRFSQSFSKIIFVFVIKAVTWQIDILFVFLKIGHQKNDLLILTALFWIENKEKIWIYKRYQVSYIYIYIIIIIIIIFITYP